MNAIHEDPESHFPPELTSDFGPREGEETEVIEKGGGKKGRGAQLRHGPRDGEPTEPLEEGDRPRAAAPRRGDRTENLPQG